MNAFRLMVASTVVMVLTMVILFVPIVFTGIVYLDRFAIGSFVILVSSLVIMRCAVRLNEQEHHDDDSI